MKITKLSGQATTIKADRDLFSHLSASASSRNVDLSHQLSHELASIPLSLATSDRNLQMADKSALSHILADGHDVKELPHSTDRTCIIIDVMALVQSISKPLNVTTFGDLADIYYRDMFNYFSETCTRVDVVFDTYRAKSIKARTRESSEHRKLDE